MNQELSDIESFQEFYHQYFVPVMRYCTSIVRDEAEASDIVQQVFIALWQRRGELQIHTSPKAYLYRTVYNFSINSVRQTAARKSREIKAGYFKSETDHADAASEQELQNLIEQAINRLPEGCRKIFQLSRNENLKYRQIAAELKISEKTVESQMGKALKLLRVALQDYLPFFILLTFLTNE